MIETIKSDIEADINQLKFSEKDAQGDYEELIKTSKKKREDSTEAITAKEGLQAKLEANVAKVRQNQKQANKDLMAVDQVILNLKAECTNFLKSFDEEKTARSDEVENLKKAKAILHGA